MSADDEFIPPLLVTLPIHPDELEAMQLVQLLDRLQSEAVERRAAQLAGGNWQLHHESIARIRAEITRRCAAQPPQEPPQPE